METKIKQLKISYLRPSGNDTALVEGLFDKERRIEINNMILKERSDIEQVGFYKVQGQQLRLEMAGGEFCGNALRSLAYLHWGK